MLTKDYTFITNTLKDTIDSNSIEEIRAMSKVLLNYIETQLKPVETPIIIKASNYTNRMAVIRELRQLFGLSLVEAKNNTETFDNIIYKGTDTKKALELCNKINKYCHIEIKGGNEAFQVLYNK